MREEVGVSREESGQQETIQRSSEREEGRHVNPGSKLPVYVLLSHGISLTKHKDKIIMKFKMVATEY